MIERRTFAVNESPVELDAYSMAILCASKEPRARASFDRGLVSARQTIGVRYGAEGNDEIAGPWVEMVETDQRSVRSSIADALADVKETTPTVIVDISAMSKSIMADVVIALVQHGLDAEVSVTFIYAPAPYHPPSTKPPFIKAVEPIANEFAGWWTDLQYPTTGIMSVGYEYEKAIGAADLLELQDPWIFLPESFDSRYDSAVRDANTNLLDWSGPDRLLSYPVLDPLGTFGMLESMVAGLIGSSRVLILPLGPKIFALSAMLVGAAYAPDVAVWRVSSGPDLHAWQDADQPYARMEILVPPEVSDR